jgi:hypothetical protein
MENKFSTTPPAEGDTILLLTLACFASGGIGKPQKEHDGKVIGQLPYLWERF